MQMIFKNKSRDEGGSDFAGNAIESQVGAGPRASSSSPIRRNGRWARGTHAFLGAVSALNLLLLISTGFLLQHASLLRLDEKIVSRKILPGSYRPQDGANGVRADIFVADLHSGRLFGTTGALVLDGITLAWLVLLATGLLMYVRRQRATRLATGRIGSSDEDD
jgi:hypothetical protein